MKIRSMVAALGLAVSTLVVMAAPAQAFDHDGHTYYAFRVGDSNQRMFSLKAPDDAYDDVGLRSADYANRYWYFEQIRSAGAGAPQYHLVNWPYPGLPGLCLDVDEPVAPGAGLRVAACETADLGQRWQLAGSRIVHAPTGLVVGVRGGVIVEKARLELQTPTGASYQTFHLEL